MDIPVIKEIITTPISAGDEKLAEIFGITEGQAGTYRREMKWFPKYAKGLLNGGKIAEISVFRDYLAYRKSFEWEKEKSKIKSYIA